jgi:hypothetical protein
MIDLPPYTTTARADVDDSVIELVNTDNQVVLRFRYQPGVPETSCTELVIDADIRDNRLGTRFITQVFDDLKGIGCTTVRIVKPNDTQPYVKYGCTIDGQDAIVDLEHGTTLDMLKASL